MSKTCGDMARYNRLRKHKIRKRAQMATLRTEVQAQKAAPVPEAPKSKA